MQCPRYYPSWPSALVVVLDTRAEKNIAEPLVLCVAHSATPSRASKWFSVCIQMQLHVGHAEFTEPRSSRRTKTKNQSLSSLNCAKFIASALTASVRVAREPCKATGRNSSPCNSRIFAIQERIGQYHCSKHARIPMHCTRSARAQQRVSAHQALECLRCCGAGLTAQHAAENGRWACGCCADHRGTPLRGEGVLVRSLRGLLRKSGRGGWQRRRLSAIRKAAAR